jgi:hypothetical protein
VALLDGEDCLNSLIGYGLLKSALEFSHVEAFTVLIRGDNRVAVLVRDVCARLLLGGVAHLLIVTLTLVDLQVKTITFR